jgi:hypothetical protein
MKIENRESDEIFEGIGSFGISLMQSYEPFKADLGG